MIIKNGTLREHAVAWSLFLILFLCIFGITLFFGRFAGAEWDTNLLLLLNPDQYIPVLDELIIFQTDFCSFYLALLPMAWVIGYYSSRNSIAAQARARKIFHGLAILFGVWHGLGMFIQDKGIFWWPEYEYPVVFLPLGLLFFFGFYFAGNLFVWLDDENQRKLAQAFWLSFIAVFFVNVIGEDSIKEMVGRPRPLNDAHAAWNGQVRILPDEIIRGSYSYISGHTSSFWAQTMIYFLLIKSWRFRVPLLLLGFFHGFTRIYTAAHFPYCVIMATLFGITVTSLVYYCLWNHSHLPLVTMLFLTSTLFSLGKSPVLPATILVITITWFAVYQYRHRNSVSSPPLDNRLHWKQKA